MAAKSRLVGWVTGAMLATATGVVMYLVHLDDRPTNGRVAAAVGKSNSVEPPSWSPDGRVALKGQGEQIFRRGMDAYLRGDYSGAASSLYQASAVAPESAEVH